jgi:hypothetical protein
MLMKYKLLLRNFIGLLIAVLPVFIIIEYTDRSLNCSLMNGILNSIIFASLLSLGIFILDSAPVLNIKEQDKIDKIKERLPELNNIADGEVYIDKSDTLFGDIEFRFKNGIILISGSKYRINKILKGII